MKRAHTSKLVFLGAWLAVSMMGYIASRASVIAGTGQNDCIPCDYCAFMDTWWGGGKVDNGQVWTADEHTPAGSAVVGIKLGNFNDGYTSYGCDGMSTHEECENYVTEVTYASATFECKITQAPPPVGIYKCEDGQTMTLGTYSFCPVFCNP